MKYKATIGLGLLALLLVGMTFGGAPPGYGPPYESGPGPTQGPWGGRAGWAASEDLPQPIVTRQTVFVIPFHILPAQDSSQQPVEVQLYVSTDLGRRWQLYHRVRPSDGQFLVRTTGEGEYWFLVRTVDRAGRVRPQSPPRPEMRVVVDTTPPRLELAADGTPSGPVTIRWKMIDRTLRPETLRIAYRTGPEGPWQPVPIETQQTEAIPEGQEGRLLWTPPPAVMRADLRAEVSDGAGNLAVAHAQVQIPIPPAAAALNPPSNTLQQDQWRATRREVPSQPLLPENALGASSGPSLGGPPSPPTAPNGSSQVAAGGEIPPSSLASAGPVAGPVHPPIQSQFPSTGLQDRGDPRGNPEPSLPRNSAPSSTPAPTQPIAGSGPQAELGAPNLQTGATAPAGADSAVGSQTKPPASQPSGSSSPPKSSTSPATPAHSLADQPHSLSQQADGPTHSSPEVSARMVNSRIFELEYELGGPNVSGRVELWATRDGGKTWQCWGPDTDNRSPMIVSAPEEGVYGFRVLVSDDPRRPSVGPAPGETPDVWIGVDWTPPTGRIAAVEPIPTGQAPQVRIRWEAADRHLADRPISLFYSPTGAGGSWTPIAAELPNTGQYTWTVPANAPDRVYIRLEIRDRAGNLTVDQTREAVSVGQPAERAKIRDVRPVNPTSRGFSPGRLS